MRTPIFPQRHLKTTLRVSSGSRPELREDRATYLPKVTRDVIQNILLSQGKFSLKKCGWTNCSWADYFSATDGLAIKDTTTIKRMRRLFVASIRNVFVVSLLTEMEKSQFNLLTCRAELNKSGWFPIPNPPFQHDGKWHLTCTSSWHLLIQRIRHVETDFILFQEASRSRQQGNRKTSRIEEP